MEQVKSFYAQNNEQLEFFKHTLLEKKAIKLIIDKGKIVDVEPEKTNPVNAQENSENDASSDAKSDEK